MFYPWNENSNINTEFYKSLLKKFKDIFLKSWYIAKNPKYTFPIAKNVTLLT